MGRKKLVAEWAASTLIVPPGHYRAGEPMVLLGFAVDWLRASWDAHEAGDLDREEIRQERDRGGPGGRLPGRSLAASWLAWGDCFL